MSGRESRRRSRLDPELDRVAEFDSDDGGLRQIVDRDGHDLGRLRELVVERRTGRIWYAVIDVDADSGDRQLPVPWAALRFEGRDRACLPLRKRRLGDAPLFDLNEIDDIGRREVGVEIFAYYGVQPPWTPSDHQSLSS